MSEENRTEQPEEPTSTGAEKQKLIEELTPPNHDYSHQDSLFGNAFSSKAYFVVHPEWLSENVVPPKSVPLERPPWPWEQPRYRQNIKIRDHIAANEQKEESLASEKQTEIITTNGNGMNYNGRIPSFGPYVPVQFQ